MSFLNGAGFAAGLSAAGGAVADTAGKEALVIQKADLDARAMELGNTLQAQRETALEQMREGSAAGLQSSQIAATASEGAANRANTTQNVGAQIAGQQGVAQIGAGAQIATANIEANKAPDIVKIAEAFHAAGPDTQKAITDMLAAEKGIPPGFLAGGAAPGPASAGTAATAPAGTGGTQTPSPATPAGGAGPTSSSPSSASSAPATGIVKNAFGDRVNMDALNSLPAALRNVVQAQGEYRTAPVNPSSRSGIGPLVSSAVAQVYPDYDSAIFSTRQDALKDFNGSGQSGQTVQSLNTLVPHLQTLSGLATAMKNGDAQLVNKFKNDVAEWAGGAAPTNFDAVKGLVADEITKAALGSAGALGDRDSVKEDLSRINSPDQLNGAISNYAGLATDRLASLKQQYMTSTRRNDFDTKLLPETRASLAALAQGAGTTASPAAPPIPPPKPPAPSGPIALPSDDPQKAFDGLPSGALFTGPDGVTRRKP